MVFEEEPPDWGSVQTLPKLLLHVHEQRRVAVDCSYASRHRGRDATPTGRDVHPLGAGTRRRIGCRCWCVLDAAAQALRLPRRRTAPGPLSRSEVRHRASTSVELRMNSPGSCRGSRTRLVPAPLRRRRLLPPARRARCGQQQRQRHTSYALCHDASHPCEQRYASAHRRSQECPPRVRPSLFQPRPRWPCPSIL